MTGGSLDANVLLRLLLNDVPDQHRAALTLVTNGDDYEVSDVALIEVAFVLGRAYGLDRAQQREAIIGLLDLPGIQGSRELFGTAFDLYLDRPKLSLEDCYLVVRAQLDRREPLWTFDRKLANQSRARLVEIATTR
ncbi:PIN domain-containing protein [Microlunatus speluncae]|uniref:PIN domain-containing protein n=1 Tax=Microlunatus speluncae TaxID=2594267 RepID=UPI0012665677|nr:PIN domain-containing protein [Microlunatus speluncae]